ncbi:GTPase ObgE [Candidatus Azambacteria bacterium]|nr:GTPase ObgE [Candidatus Azambacteria bacterium]
MFIDNVVITIKGGNGGDGRVAFRKIGRGPTGADGGQGGNVYFEGVSNLTSLAQFAHKRIFSAPDGQKGGDQFRDGAGGKDLIFKVPVGTVISIQETNQIKEILKVKEKILIAWGGQGGWGNFKLRSSTNTTPTQFKRGALGQRFTVRLELKLIAQVGLIGLPNAGKSSLLNNLTRSKSKVANYPFTTLEPSLGVYHDLILADIPGLIEGASKGKGLGIKFLQHIERTAILFHLISSESEDVKKDYQIIRKELESYSDILAEKEEYILLTKSDLRTNPEIKRQEVILKKLNKKLVTISLLKRGDLEKVEKILNKIVLEF